MQQGLLPQILNSQGFVQPFIQQQGYGAVNAISGQWQQQPIVQNQPQPMYAQNLGPQGSVLSQSDSAIIRVWGQAPTAENFDHSHAAPKSEGVGAGLNASEGGEVRPKIPPFRGNHDEMGPIGYQGGGADHHEVPNSSSAPILLDDSRVQDGKSESDNNGGREQDCVKIVFKFKSEKYNGRKVRAEQALEYGSVLDETHRKNLQSLEDFKEEGEKL